ncbi:MAG TPA: hypothetical protein VNW97_07200 [Candidatus Saccharimonadales bacterium]|nr:hypothetical protein [Candidatus Saccharimonadales bacterium]
MDELKVPSGVPHVIAHSLGTFLVGGIIEKFPDIRLDRLILTGCVLKRSTPWAEYLRRNPKAVKSVRNEMAGRDIVSKLAVVFCGFFPGLGHAGISGFTDYSHNIEPNSGCDIECAALVHNVSLRDLSHSDVFVGPGHARRFWLPFLWGLDPKDYEEFMEMCQLANESERLGFVKELGIVEDELRNRPWRWTNNLTLNDYLKEQIECLLKRKGVRPLRDRIRRMRDLAVAEMWHTIAQAYAIQDTGLGDPLILRNLHPKIAAAHAVRSVEA